MYHCIICHHQFDLKSLWYMELETPRMCVTCLYSTDYNSAEETECFFCPKEA